MCWRKEKVVVSTKILQVVYGNEVEEEVEQPRKKKEEKTKVTLSRGCAFRIVTVEITGLPKAKENEI